MIWYNFVIFIELILFIEPCKAHHTQEASMNFNVTHFNNLEVEWYYLQMNGRTFIQEWGFDPSLIDYNITWELVDFHLGVTFVRPQLNQRSMLLFMNFMLS